MSKIYSKYLELKNEDPSQLYLFRSGKFYIFIDEDADLINQYVVLKKTKFTNEVLKCGFPDDRFEDYMRVFKNHNLSISVVESQTVSDQHLLEFTKLLIYDDESPVGIPIGNYTSQYFANIYLNELDHFVKEELRIEFYVRYMDDFILLVPTKEKARYLKKRIEEYVETKLCLHLNSKSRYYSNESGVDFCGYRIYETHRLLRKRSKQKIRNLVKKANGDFEKGVLNYQKVRACYNSWKAHASHANTFHLIRKYHAQFLISDYLDL